MKVSILPYVGSVCYLSRQICFGSPDFSGADALSRAMIPHRNAAAAAAVSFSNCDSHGLPPLDLVFRVLLPTIAIDATPIMVFF